LTEVYDQIEPIICTAVGIRIRILDNTTKLSSVGCNFKT